MRDTLFHTYIMASQSRVLYTGVTSNLRRRIAEHRAGLGDSFPARYHCTRLVWCAAHADEDYAIAHEKHVKAMARSRKIALIQQTNPLWIDLAEDLPVPDAWPSSLRKNFPVFSRVFGYENSRGTPGRPSAV